jgi:putative FmdB family regulatory protein
MPIYEYRCESCAERFEEYLSTSDKPAPPCPKCGATSVARLFSPFATEWLPSDVNWHRASGSW